MAPRLPSALLAQSIPLYLGILLFLCGLALRPCLVSPALLWARGKRKWEMSDTESVSTTLFP